MAVRHIPLTPQNYRTLTDCLSTITPEEKKLLPSVTHPRWPFLHYDYRITQVDEYLYRSSCPSRDELIQAKSLGVEQIFNLREECDKTVGYALELDMMPYHISCKDMSAPKLDDVNYFLYLMEDPVKSLIFCMLGIGRTGTFISAYRIVRGMSVEEAIRVTDAEVAYAGFGMTESQKEFLHQNASAFRREPTE